MVNVLSGIARIRFVFASGAPGIDFAQLSFCKLAIRRHAVGHFGADDLAGLAIDAVRDLVGCEGFAVPTSILSHLAPL